MSMYDSTVDCMAHNFHINISELLRGNKNLNYKKVPKGNFTFLDIFGTSLRAMFHTFHPPVLLTI